MEEQQIAIERFEKALAYVDKLLPLLPTFSHFNISSIILTFGWTQQEIDEAYNLDTYIQILLINKLKYADEQNGSFWIQLNDLGRAAQKAGGHFKYELKLEKIANRNDKKEDFDLEIKRLALKYKFVTFGIPFISLAIAIISIFFTFYKEHKLVPPQTQLNLKLTIQSDTQKNVLLLDTSLKK